MNRFLKAFIALSTAAVLSFVAIGCAQAPDGAASVSVGSDSVSGILDDGGRFYATTLQVSRGEATLTEATWGGVDPVSNARINIRPGAGLEPSSGFYGLPDNTDSLPLSVGSPVGAAADEIRIVLIFPEAQTPPEGELVLSYRSGENTGTVQIAPRWSDESEET